MNHIAHTPVQEPPGSVTPPLRSAMGIIETQRVPVTWALLAATVFFVLLGAKNLWEREYVVTGLCATAVVVALLYAHAIYHQRPRPLSDVTLTGIVLAVLAATIDKRGWVGVLWCHPLMLMLHLVTGQRTSIVFDAVTLALATGYTYAAYGASTAFRVCVILLISSAFAHIYARVVDAHQRRQEEQRQHLDLMVRCANVGGLEWQAEGQAMTCSDRLADMLQTQGRHAAPGWSILDHVAPPDRQRLEQTLFAPLQGRTAPREVRHSAPQDFRFLLPDGSDLWLHAECMTLSDPHGQPHKLMATFIDVSRLRAAEANTLAALNRQRELNELRARFVAMTSHEFRTPLATILSAAELMQHYGHRMPDDEKQEVLSGISAGVGRMTEMLERILLINKAEAQMLEFQPRPTDLAQVCLQLAEDVRQQHKADASRLRVDCQPPDAKGHFDVKLLQHIFGNLLSNALKYSGANTLVTFRARVSGTEAVFEVIDQGIGIPPEDMGELFEPFHRGSNVGELKGTGLGLTIVKKSVDLHRGMVEVKSEVGAGTCFRVTLFCGEST